MSSTTDDDDVRIYGLTVTCAKLFEELVGKRSQLETNSHAIIRDHHLRFEHWADFIGALTDDQACLDNRLRPYPEVRDLVMQMLQMLHTNLQHVLRLEDETTTSSRSSEDTRENIREDPMERFENDPKNNHRTKAARLGADAAIDAVREAIDRLQRLAIIIRRSSTATLASRVTRFSLKTDAAENAEFNRLMLVRLNGSLPGISKSLVDQLLQSIAYRRLRLIYQRSHQDKLRKRRSEHAAQAPQEKPQAQDKNLPTHDYTLISQDRIATDVEKRKMTTERAVRTKSQLKSDTSHSGRFNPSIFQHHDSQEQAIIRDNITVTSIAQGYSYPNPPKIPQGFTSTHCHWCFEEITASDLQTHGWWRAHLNRDLQPYVCISEDCVDPPIYFTSYKSWREHMDQTHTVDWARTVHSPKVWYCDMETDEYQEFQTVEDLRNHISSAHPDKLTEAQLNKKLDLSALSSPRRREICPLCNQNGLQLQAFQPEYSIKNPDFRNKGKEVKSTTFHIPEAEISSEESEIELKQESQEELPIVRRKKMAMHVASHLKSLSVLSIRYMDEESQSVGSNDAAAGIEDTMSGQDQLSEYFPLSDGALDFDDVTPDQRSTDHYGWNDEEEGPEQSEEIAIENQTGDIFSKSPDNTSKKPYQEYTVAWMCTLAIEIEAARAMLDEVHDLDPTPLTKNNVYVAGRIKYQHVIVARNKQGPGNQMLALAELRQTFPAIKAALVVGIGGGAPSEAYDVRLGDVVVGSNEVRLYDSSPMVTTRNRNKVKFKAMSPWLRELVLMMRDKHTSEEVRLPSILQDIVTKYPQYGRPDLADDLFQPTYDHEKNDNQGCQKCDPSKRVPRQDRGTVDPLIHYGPIASGNSPVNDGRTRDNLATVLDIICFDTENADVYLAFPCVMIRGICDYSDSHKNQRWQKYAAATSAAYTKEFIEAFSMSSPAFGGPGMNVVDLTSHHYPSENRLFSQDRRDWFVSKLWITPIESRRRHIKAVSLDTCEWFFDLPQTKAWLDHGQQPQHEGLLWIEGGAGTGKSTMMKSIYSKMSNEDRCDASLTAGFFFYSLGTDMERSITGMYCSLLFQLVSGYTDLQHIFDAENFQKDSRGGIFLKYGEPLSLHILKSLLSTAISFLGNRSFTVFIDALDEYDESPRKEVHQYFEGLYQESIMNGIRFRVCFSSGRRHDMKTQRRSVIILEDQPGHVEDLSHYARTHLREPMIATVAEGIVARSAGVFLWVILVVNDMNDQYDRGNRAFMECLKATPRGLSPLLNKILSEDRNTLWQYFRWILDTPHLLRPEEFYEELKLEGLVKATVPTPPIQVLESIILRVTKGLVEIKQEGQLIVHFIHECVGDFLRAEGNVELSPKVESHWQDRSHERIKNFCASYLNQLDIPTSVSNRDERDHILEKHPLLAYAVEDVLFHANAAANTVTQDVFLSTFDVRNWIEISNLLDDTGSHNKYTPNTGLLFVLANEGFTYLVRTVLEMEPDTDILGESDESPLLAAVSNGNKDTISALLRISSYMIDGIDITDGLDRTGLGGYARSTPLIWASGQGLFEMVRVLLNANRHIANREDSQGRVALLEALKNGHEETARTLILGGAEVQIADRMGVTPMLLASQQGFDVIVRLCAENGADINENCGPLGGTLLLHAAAAGHEEIVRLLLDGGADIEAKDTLQKTALMEAIEGRHKNVVGLLIERGADVDCVDAHGNSALTLAMEHRDSGILSLLRDAGVTQLQDGEALS